ncbi:MAG: HNH endonuclease [Floccifex sp.]
MANNRGMERYGVHRQAFEKAKKRILKEQCICGICGKPVDKKIKYPHPMSATIDHIIPIDRGGHPSDINNLQLAHFKCNRQKADKIPGIYKVEDDLEVGNRVLPLAMDWRTYRS